VTLIVLISRRRSRQPEARLRAVSRDVLSNILIPAAEHGEIQLEYVLLCGQGIVVLNIKDVVGNVFGSDSMGEWAVITDKARYAFRNPQDGLYDRVAAIKRLLPDVPVQGYIAFPGTAVFTKGTPAHVVLFDTFIDEMARETAPDANMESYQASWETLKAMAKTPD